jgi:DNA-directed RNA polymerase specialized sigma24 family protein
MTLDALQCCFTDYLPDMRRIASRRFRHLDPDKRDEAIQNTLALCWKFYVALFRKGRANQGILTSVLWYAIKQTKSRRTVQGKGKSKDALDYRDRGRTTFEQADLNGLIGRNTPVPDRVSFRVDVPAFLSTLKPRQQALAYDLATGMTTSEVAEKHGVTSGAISQFRSRFKRWFDEFFAE